MVFDEILSSILATVEKKKLRREKGSLAKKTGSFVMTKNHWEHYIRILSRDDNLSVKEKKNGNV